MPGRQMAPLRPSVLVAAALGLLVARVRAQIYQFDAVPVPESKSLHTMYAFYVYSHQEAPDKSLGQPFVKFHNLVAHSTSADKKDSELTKYRGVQLSILPYRDFWNLINPNKFCSTNEDVSNKLSHEEDHLLVRKPATITNNADVYVYSHTVEFPQEAAAHHAKDPQVPVRSTGVYVLVYSNCGDFADAVVSGSVVVKNSYGFLPGNEYHKMPFYGWLSLGYGVLALVWMGISLRWWRELFAIQNCITAVILFGLVEAFIWWIFFNEWNKSGVRGRFLFIMSILSSVVKSIFSYMLVLVASLGWGVTRPYLDHRTIMKVQAVSFLYIVLDFIRESVLSFRHSHSLSLAFVLLCLLPVSLLNGGIFYWIFTALSSLIETLRERRQNEKLVLYQRLWRLLVCALAIASFTLLFQIFDLSRSISIRWKYQWFLADGVSHILFMMVLAALMYLWAPHTNSQRYAYSSQVSTEDQDGDAKPAADVAGTPWADEDGLDDANEDESFWATTHASKNGKDGLEKTTHAVSADVIGVSPDVEQATAAAEKD